MKSIFAILICVVLFTTCKKYPEGGYHFRYLKNLEGNWKLKLYEVDGVDSTMLTVGANTIPNYLENFARIGSQKSRRVTYIFLDNHNLSYSLNINYKKYDMLTFKDFPSDPVEGTHCITENNALLCQRNIFNPTSDKYFSWKIQKLTKNELKLISINYNYKLILEKK